ncbi:hypothetical protein ISF_03527 [Cordyceps fumosorosea ARSEF 2679]|uniref:Vacuolar protein sorting-associated protein VTA1 n=1 Tax=Cordyceps fumosorosea (strain ARSEF 2679) TaxID=1081104 RepID=A0A162JHP9_CORFA|nr:hypothetical protein ISF_03527 [Cordyceps fumosorosea ARSEF 2679]OAA69152.1 hypothetical protein ISF_03527 [Cordyceps fumosorosea ARSEF 2679]
MAEPLPAALKIPEISRFVNRANQLRAVKPALAYWCEYHAVNQIVGKGLHTTDDDCFQFTRALIERLEATKAERPDDDAIVDNAAGQAYVEVFAQETLDRAERTMRANKVTRQTADTFDAAATFFDLTREWGPPEPETLQKIKFAKWNAARILKAIRQGQDPNESNPKAPEPEAALSPEDLAEIGLDPAATGGGTDNAWGPPPVSLEEVPDAGEPLPPTTDAEAGSFFPAAPPSPPTATSPEPPFVPSPITTPPPPPAQAATNLQPTPSPSSSRPHVPPPQPSSPIPTRVAPEIIPPPEPLPAVQPREVPASVMAPSAAPVPTPAYAPATNIHRKDLNQAQKHAKWAISALNFDDVPTAIKELRNALAMLGAQ